MVIAQSFSEKKYSILIKIESFAMTVQKCQKNGLKKWIFFSKNVENHQETVKIQQKHQFSTFFEFFFRFFSTIFFGIFELLIQCSKF